MSSIPQPKFIYLEPKIKASSVSLVIIIIVFFAFIILKWNYMYSNWDDIKCQNTNFYIAPIFGKDSSQTFSECTKQIQTDIIEAEMSPIHSRIDGMDSNITNINAALNKTIQTTTDLNSQANQNVLNLSTTIQQNIINVKNALSKILGSVVLSTYMTNGTIQSSKNLGNNILTDVVSNFTEANTAEQQALKNQGTFGSYMSKK
jgi:hypothetical protein